MFSHYNIQRTKNKRDVWDKLNTLRKKLWGLKQPEFVGNHKKEMKMGENPLMKRSLNKEMIAHVEYNIYNVMTRRHLEKDSFTL